MEARAISKYVRVAPRKARLVVDMIRGRRVEEALGILEFTLKRAGRMIAKTVKSAVANAENTQNVDVDRLYVKQAFVDGGPTIKRFMPRAHGRATRVNKRTSHVTIVVDERQQ
jgi:large subunit ribosomal protein L22